MTSGRSSSITTGKLGEAAIRELELELAGSVVGPGDTNYETARRVWNHAIDKRPALIVRAASAEDVVGAVGFARRQGQPIAIRGGAHGAAGFSTCDHGIVIDIDLFNVAYTRSSRAFRTYRMGTCRAKCLGDLRKRRNVCELSWGCSEVDVDRSYPPQIHTRLQAVKNQYDPLNVFRFNINIRPAK
jgi:hypothetical protein